MARFLRYCLCVVVLVSPVAFSASRTIVVQPGELQPTYSPGQDPYAFSDSRSWKEPVSTQTGSRVNVPVTKTDKTGWPKFRAGLKNAFKRNPAAIIGNAVVAGAVGAVGWVMSDDNTKLQKKVSDGQPVPTPTYGYDYVAFPDVPDPACHSNLYPDAETTNRCHQLNSDLKDGRFTFSMSNLAPLTGASKGLYYIRTQKWKYNGQVIGTTGVTLYARGNCAPPLVLSASYTCVDPQGAIFADLEDSDIDSLTSSITDPADAAAIAPDVISSVPGSYDYPDGTDFTGPASIQGEPVTTTTQGPDGTTVTTSTPSYSFDYSTNPLSITTTTNNTTTVYNNGTLVSTTTSTNAGTVVDAPPTTEAPEVPTDCEFMPTVCEFIAWFKTPTDMPEPDMPEPVDDDFQQTYSASFGGACPAPRTVHTDNFGTLSISWQPICDLAFYIKFLVIGGASLFAAYIGLGISRGKT